MTPIGASRRVIQGGGSEFPVIVEDFERSNPLNDYNLDTGSFTISQTQVKNGSNSLFDGNSNGTGIWTRSLNTLPAQGDVFRVNKYRTADATDSAYIIWGVPSSPITTAKLAEGYHILTAENTLTTPSDGAILRKLDSGGNFTQLASTSFEPPENEWLEFEIEWYTNGDMTCRVFDSSGTQLGTDFTGNDTTYTDGGIGWRRDNEGVYFDYMRITGGV